MQGFSVKEPDVIVSTPAAFLNYLYAIDPEKHRRADFIRGVKFVVIFDFLTLALQQMLLVLLIYLHLNLR